MFTKLHDGKGFAFSTLITVANIISKGHVPTSRLLILLFALIFFVAQNKVKL